MSAPVNITFKHHIAEVQEGALVVSQSPIPPDIPKQTLPYVKKLTIDGDGVTESLLVDGSVSNKDAFVESEEKFDVYVTSMSIFLLGDATKIRLRDFGSIADGLTNGCILFYQTPLVQFTLEDYPIKTNGDFTLLGSQTPSFGVDSSAFRMKDVLPGANQYAYNPRLDLVNIAPPYGLKLPADTKSALGIKIRDDLTAAGGFRAVVLGFKVPHTI